jgi:undecaprenyl pyrophosphate synthase
MKTSSAAIGGGGSADRDVRSIAGKHVLVGLDGSRRYARGVGITAEASYRQLPQIAVRTARRLLCTHGAGAVSIWLLQEYNLRREPATVEILINISLDSICALSNLCTSIDAELSVVGELASINSIRPDWLDDYDFRETPINQVDGLNNSSNRQQIYLILAYNHEKEFSRSMHRCNDAGLTNPSMSDIAERWSFPRVDLFLRTGQPNGMVNLSAYWPGIERGRIIATDVYPQQFLSDDIDRLVDLYTSGIDSSTLLPP